MEISGSLMSAGLHAMQTGQQKAVEAAQNVASMGSGDMNIADLTTQLMQMEQAKVMTEAGAKMVESADEALGTVINTMA